MGGVEGKVEQHPARGDMPQVVGVPDGPVRCMHRPPRVSGGTVPQAKELTTFSKVPVGTGEQQAIGTDVVRHKGRVLGERVVQARGCKRQVYVSA